MKLFNDSVGKTPAYQVSRKTQSNTLNNNDSKNEYASHQDKSGWGEKCWIYGIRNDSKHTASLQHESMASFNSYRTQWFRRFMTPLNVVIHRCVERNDNIIVLSMNSNMVRKFTLRASIGSDRRNSDHNLVLDACEYFSKFSMRMRCSPHELWSCLFCSFHGWLWNERNSLTPCD